jgi:hypothetical protein
MRVGSLLSFKLSFHHHNAKYIRHPILKISAMFTWIKGVEYQSCFQNSPTHFATWRNGISAYWAPHIPGCNWPILFYIKGPQLLVVPLCLPILPFPLHSYDVPHNLSLTADSSVFFPLLFQSRSETGRFCPADFSRLVGTQSLPRRSVFCVWFLFCENLRSDGEHFCVSCVLGAI